MKIPISIIDVFAGPGGLGEGFASVENLDGSRAFKIRLSVEMEASAHQTLLLRSFFRQFWPVSSVPESYYDFLKSGQNQIEDFSTNYVGKAYRGAWKDAQREAWHHTLGTDMPLVHQRIREALDGSDNWVLIGGPPCQAYSIAGRGRVNGIDPEDHRVHLYKYYLEIIARHAPKVFVMENVRGLLSAKLEGKSIFSQILKDLQNPNAALHGEEGLHEQAEAYRIYSFVKPPSKDLFDGNHGYRPLDYLIESEKYGIPQRRHRVILLGVREDLAQRLDMHPDSLEEKDDLLPLLDVIGDLPPVRSGLSRGKDNPDQWRADIRDMLNGDFETQVREKCENGEAVWQRIKQAVLEIRDHPFSFDKGANFLEPEAGKLPSMKEDLARWFHDERLQGTCNHFARSHMQADLFRYLFSACYTEVNHDSPKLRHYPESLLPNHKSANTTKFPDRFRTQQFDIPATTITSHISKDGHYYIHPDPAQCRSLTVREAARIQTFPDNYYFMGNQTSQYTQVGNAVPPLLANQLAEIVLRILQKDVAGVPASPVSKS